MRKREGLYTRHIHLRVQLDLATGRDVPQIYKKALTSREGFF